MRQIFCLLILIMACSGFGHAQTQDWTGVPQPGNDPQLQQLYAQAVAQANQTYAAAQQYMPNTAGVGAQYTAWVKESTILFDAKWDYWQLLNPHGAMTNNPQYMKDWAAYQSQCFPQCPNFANSGSANAGGKSTNPTAPINTINQSLYGAAALSRGLVSPTAEAQQEADAEASYLYQQVFPTGGNSTAETSPDSDDPLTYTGPRELDFNHPETLPDTMPGVTVIVFPPPGNDGMPEDPPCMTAMTCANADNDSIQPGNYPAVSSSNSEGQATVPAPTSGSEPSGASNTTHAGNDPVLSSIPAAAFSSTDPTVQHDLSEIVRLDSTISTATSFKQDIADNQAQDQATALIGAGLGLFVALKGPADTAAALIGTTGETGKAFADAYGVATAVAQASSSSITNGAPPDITALADVSKAVNEGYGLPGASAVVNGLGAVQQYKVGDQFGGFTSSIAAEGNSLEALGSVVGSNALTGAGSTIAAASNIDKSLGFSASAISNSWQNLNASTSSIPNSYATLAARNQAAIDLAIVKRQALINDLNQRLGSQ